MQLWDNKTQHYFLKLFGRPQRMSSCSCERNIEPSVAQVLHLFNSPEIQQKLAHDRGTVAKLVARRPGDAELVDDLYLTILSRSPTGRERDIAVSHLANHASERRQAAEDPRLDAAQQPGIRVQPLTEGRTHDAILRRHRLNEDVMCSGPVRRASSA